jgi:protein-L-isoaspartate(D-aspartate) O-methyltransferase
MTVEQRERMVEQQIVSRGIRDRRVLEAMRSVPREQFVDASQAEFAYVDSALGIAHGQTISQPFMVALMAASLDLDGSERVLEVGTGSGYGAAVLGRLARQVHTIERHAPLAATAAERLVRGGFSNVEVVMGDGTLGLPGRAPFDAIAVTAGGPHVPPALREQLAIGGRLVMPVGAGRETQQLIRVRRLSRTEYAQEDLEPVRSCRSSGSRAGPTAAPLARRGPPHATTGRCPCCCANAPSPSPASATLPSTDWSTG